MIISAVEGRDLGPDRFIRAVPEPPALAPSLPPAHADKSMWGSVDAGPSVLQRESSFSAVPRFGVGSSVCSETISSEGLVGNLGMLPPGGSPLKSLPP